MFEGKINYPSPDDEDYVQEKFKLRFSADLSLVVDAEKYKRKPDHVRMNKFGKFEMLEKKKEYVYDKDKSFCIAHAVDN